MTLMVVAMLIGWFTSCNTSKNVNKTQSYYDRSVEKSLKRQIDEKNLLIAHYESRIRELETLGVVFTECPNIDSILDAYRYKLISGGCKQSTVDSLLSVISNQKATIKKNADGSLEINGRIASLQQSKQRDEKTIINLQNIITRLTNENDSLKVNVKTKTEVKTVEKKTSFIPWWVWIVALSGYVIFLIKSKK